MKKTLFAIATTDQRKARAVEICRKHRPSHESLRGLSLREQGAAIFQSQIDACDEILEEITRGAPREKTRIPPPMTDAQADAQIKIALDALRALAENGRVSIFNRTTRSMDDAEGFCQNGFSIQIDTI